MQAFVNQTSGHEGAEVPSDMNPDVSFDDPAFWRELKSALGVAADKHGIDLDQLSDSGSSSDGFGEEEEDDGDNVSSSSEEVTDDSDDGVSQHTHARADGVAQPHTQTSLAQGKPAVPQWQHPAAGDSQQHFVAAPASSTAHHAEAAASDDPDDSASDVMTATDSDDEDASFMHAYDQALADELSGSRVGSIIMPDASAGANADQPDYTAAAAAAAAATSSDQAEDLQPLDLDTNLVRNLLQSYTAQQGLAGPAGNLAGLLGLNLPDHAEAD